MIADEEKYEFPKCPKCKKVMAPIDNDELGLDDKWFVFWCKTMTCPVKFKEYKRLKKRKK